MKKFLIVVFFAGLLSLNVGCDQINSLAQNLFSSNKNKQTEKKSPEVIPSIPAVKPEADPSAPLPADVLAKVGDWTLTIDQFKQRLKDLKTAIPEFDIKTKESKKLVLEELVRQQLLIMDAEQKGVGDKAEIKMAVDEFRRSLLVRETVNKLIENIKVTEEDAEKEFNQNKDLFVEPPEWKVREIVVDTQEGANEILIELLKGADFAEMAKTRSKSKSASNGGDLGFLKNLEPYLNSVVPTMETRDVSRVFKGPDGFYIIKLEEKKGGKLLEFSKVKEDIITGLTQIKQQEAVLKYIDELKAKINIKLNESLLEE